MKKGYVEAWGRFRAIRERPSGGAVEITKAAEYWSEGRGKELGAQFKTQIACLVVVEELGVSRRHLSTVIKELQDQEGPSFAPKTHGGQETFQKTLGKRARLYNADTYYRWLRNDGSISPEKLDRDLCVDLILRACDVLIKGYQKPGAATMRSILSDFRGTAHEALAQVLDTLKSTGSSRDWRLIKSRVLGVMPKEPRRSIASAGFDKKYEGVLEALRTVRSVQVSGPNYSGKNTLLRLVASSHAENGFELANGSLLSTIALSLYELSTSEAIERLADFYREALGVRQRGETVGEFIEEIAHYSRQFPALVIISGLDAVDGDEIVRALHQDLLGDVVASLLDGHVDARLLVSTSPGDRPSARRTSRRNAATKNALPFARILDMSEEGVPATNYEYNAIKQCAIALCSEQRDYSKEDLPELLGSVWFTDEEVSRRAASLTISNRLGRFVARDLLSPYERLVLGLVALSHDGLLPATLAAVTKILSGAGCAAAVTDPVGVLTDLPDAVVRKPTRIDGLGSSTFKIERALRDSLLGELMADSAATYRLACWAMARAAAADARRLRIRSGPDVSAGRDVQVIVFLLSSADVAAPPASKVRIMERRILPPLEDVLAPMPEPSAVIRFAFAVLFKEDLARSVESGGPVLGDARLRLAAVMPFLDGRPLWELTAELRNPSRWSPPAAPAPWDHLDQTARLAIVTFATSAAARLNFGRLVVAFARLAEAVVEGVRVTPEQFRLLSRVQRYELELLMMLGSDPGWAKSPVEPTGLPGLAGVAARAEWLVGAIPAHLKGHPVASSALRALLARRAEILHLRGEHGKALQEFGCTARMDAGGQLEDASEYLGGRSGRMHTRLLVEFARARLFASAGVEPVVYDIDCLALPVLNRAPVKPPTLQRAEQMAEESLRSLAHGSVNDRIGVRIDHARIAAVQLHYTEALELLDGAIDLVRTPSASRDMLLEYLSVQGRTLADGAAFVMGVGAVWPLVAGEHDPEIRRLAVYLGVDDALRCGEPWRLADAVSGKLSTRAKQSLDTLRDMVLLPDSTATRYTILADYLDVWLVVVRSRERLASDDPGQRARHVRMQLVGAASSFERVLEQMIATGYFMSLREAWLLVDVFASASIEIRIPRGMPLRDMPDAERSLGLE